MMMNVRFEAGQGVDIEGGVNYMMTADGSVYAETAVSEEVAEDYGYMALKAAIKETYHGKEKLCFLYDGQEEHLSEEAHADCEVVVTDNQEEPEEDEKEFYRILPDHLDAWGADQEHNVVEFKEIQRLAKEWDKPVSDLMDQVERIELPTVAEAIQILEANQIYIEDDSKFDARKSLAQNYSTQINLELGEIDLIVDPDTGECFADVFESGSFENLWQGTVTTKLIRAMIPDYRFPFSTI